MIYDYVNTKPPLEEVCLEHGLLGDTITKAHKYINKYMGKAGKWVYVYKKKAEKTIDDYKEDKAYTDKLKARKKWNIKGRAKVYKNRKSQIETARSNANLAYRKNPKAQYKVRSSKVKQARQNANDAYKVRLQKLEDAYKDRINQIRKSRRKTKSTHPYRKTVLKTIPVNRRFW